MIHDVEFLGWAFWGLLSFTSLTNEYKDCIDMCVMTISEVVLFRSYVFFGGFFLGIIGSVFLTFRDSHRVLVCNCKYLLLNLALVVSLILIFLKMSLQ